MSKNFTAIDDLLEKNKRISLPKETEPIAAEKFEIKEVVEHEPDEEIEKFISPRAETIKLPPDLKKLGLQAVSTSKFPG